MTNPRDFHIEYVGPAAMLWLENRGVKHLAVHAISQIDVMAEVTAFFEHSHGRPRLPMEEVRDFRKALEGREPILAVIRDAHDCHKHGALIRKSAKAASRGQRPQTETCAGFFADISFADGPLTLYSRLVLPIDDGSEIPIFDLLHDALQAWERQLFRLGL